MFNSKALLTSTVAALFCFVSASPVKPGTDVGATIQVCTSVGTGCVTLPVVSDECIDLTGGLSFLNKEISTADVPGGFICTFFQDFGCVASGVVNAGTDSEIVLQEGSWHLTSVPGLSGTTNFEDLTSSISCSPL
ncbi:HET domain-containing protein [Mycena venus]|uniref:HET domain-containing protein n=1 Tax=Mycena venus TaxID=2733690 RepID=A0A8H6YZT0_9AGAR|nr:HET domain-containing protein [Mycena venus]